MDNGSLRQEAKVLDEIVNMRDFSEHTGGKERICKGDLGLMVMNHRFELFYQI